MKTIASTEAKTNFGALLDAAQRGPVAIEKKGRPVAVMMSSEDFEMFEGLRKKYAAQEIRSLAKEGLTSGLSRQDGELFLDRLAAKYAAKGRSGKR